MRWVDVGRDRVRRTLFDPVQIVNLRSPGGRRERLAQETIASAKKVEELGLPVVDLPRLVALKLVAGSRKDELDIIELLRANPGQIESVVVVAGRYRLKKQLDRVVSAS